MSELPTGTVTFLLTDIEGSTTLWEQYPEAMPQALARHDALAAATVRQHGGVLVKSRGEGDSLFAVFARTTDAVTAACALQRALLAESWPAQTPLRVRMALHTGEADLRDGDYYGPAVNRCARLRAVAHGGQILLSAATAELVRDSLPEGAGLLDMGEQRLRDLTHSVHVFQLLHPALPSHFPSLKSLDALPNNLPRQLTSFIGWEKEMQEVRRLLASTCLLTLTGPGGGGKTRLALQVGGDLLEAFSDGVWLAELALLTDAALVPQAVASALDVREEPGRLLSQTLTEHLRQKHLLLLLDNCEHVLPACAELADTLLRACPNLRILATSREGLAIAGETTYQVPSLSRPDPRRLPANGGDLVASLSQYEAIRLFIERALATMPSFAVTHHNAPAVAQVCHQLDGIPLAIELAAARVKALPAEQIAERLDDRFRLLTGGSRTALPRQQTLRALIDWSYDLLSAQERALFHRIAVFVGGFTLEAAEQVIGDRELGTGEGQEGVARQSDAKQAEEGIFPVTSDEVLDLLSGLVDKSLLVAEDQGGRARYHLLETLRQYAREKLQQSGLLEPVQQRHFAYFLQLAEEAERKLRGSEQAWWLERLETEHDNLRAALAWHAASEADPEAGLHFASALWWFWHVRGHFTEGREWLASTLAAVPTPTTLRARALQAAGALARNQGDYATARALSEESLAIKRELGDKQGIAASLNNLATLALSQGDFAAAGPFYAESLEIERELGNRQGITATLIGLANVALEQGDYTAARNLYEESLAIKRQLDDKRGIAASLAGLGNVAACLADYTTARTHHEESLALRQHLGDKRGVANSLQNLGSVASLCGDYAEAEALFQESLAIRRELGDKQGMAAALYGRGMIALERGDYAAAETLLKECLAIYQELGNKRGFAYALKSFAYLASAQEQMTRAALLFGAAEARRESIGAPLPPNERERYDRSVAAVRDTLDAAAFKAALDQGHSLTTEQAIVYALDNAELRDNR